MSFNFSVHPKAVNDQFNEKRKKQAKQQRDPSYYISVTYSYGVYVIQDFKKSL